ncbi:MAG: sigma E protease regulator RseP [Candidatus Dasytiphilus stammeri]
MFHNILWSLIFFIITISILTTVHEYGHFFIAKFSGVHIQSFSIGFGKELFSWYDKFGTKYIIAMIPLGGFVKITDNSILPEKTFFLQRAAIISAGPIANFIFAILVYWLLFVIGIPSIRPIVSDVKQGSIAFKAGIRPGMEFKAINNVKIYDWNDVRMALSSKIGDCINIRVLPIKSSHEITKLINLHNWYLDLANEDPIISLGIYPYYFKIEPILVNIQADSPASKAGLKIGDTILKVNGQYFNRWKDFIKIVNDNQNKKIKFLIKREYCIFTVKIKPNLSKTKYKNIIGVMPRIKLFDKYQIVRKYNPFTAFFLSTKKIIQLLIFNLNIIKKIILGKIQIINIIHGPISIAQTAKKSAEYGLIYYFIFLALISINIGIVNLLPLPILDGGHLLFLILENILTPILYNIIYNICYRIGIFSLFLLMVMALFNDISFFFKKS